MDFPNTLPELELIPDDSAQKTDLDLLKSGQKTENFRANENLEEESVLNKKLKLNFEARQKKYNNDFDEEGNEKPREDILELDGRGVYAKKDKQAIFEDFNVMLNLTDVSYGVKGHNKFYQIQVHFVLFRLKLLN